MNIAIPSIIIKMMRQKFDQQWTVRKTESTSNEQIRILDLIRPAKVSVEIVLEGPTLLLEDLVKLEEGDVLTFDYSVDKPLDLLINGKRKFNGQIATVGQRMGFAVENAYGLFHTGTGAQ